ncbi:Ribosome biogenesis protein erb1 [Blastosporella zonata]|nr:Ribosome biogenesis protein erb1 [Blastosporella zonata]
MAVKEITKPSKKRKQSSEDAPAPPPIAVGELEMQSDEEGEDAVSDDGEVDEFPEIDTRSDSDDEEFEGSDEEDYSDEEEGDEDDSSDSDSLHVFPKAKTIVSDITGQPKRVYPEIDPDYDSDSSTEDGPNRVGDVPMHWYDDLPHIGYDIDGKKVLRPAKGDELDKFLSTVEDPSAWTSAFDQNTQMDKPLTDEELDIIRRLYAGEVPDAGYNPYEPTTEWFTGKGKEEIMPLSSAPEPKRRWVPIRAIRQGRIIGSKPKTISKFSFHSIWSEPSSSHPPPLPAPKPRLPTNSESYNPPEEYLPTEEERKEWEAQDPEDREQEYMPQKYSALRLVPAYDRFIKERFSRQLDLYLAPRIQRVKLNIDPTTLIPKLPSPSSLKPFPNYKSLKFTHPKGRVRCVSISPDGGWAISGDESGKVSLWEINVGREVKSWKFDSKIGALEWCPRLDVNYFVVSVEEKIHFMIPPNIPSPVLVLTQALLAPASLPPVPGTPSLVKWVTPPTSTWSTDTPILTASLPASSGLPTQLTWHRRGDYLASVSTGGTQGGVWIHQVTRRHSQAPFKKVKGAIQMVLFHPLKPHFFVATQQYVRIYNLSEQKLLKTLQPGIKWISSMDVHPSGDHLIVGGYDRKLCWFDLELSDKPYKIMRYHTRAIRSLHFHPSYPLFASSSDDGAIQIFHSRVYNDLMTDPLIVPLKILRGHEIKDGLGVLQIRWSSRQPWLASAGADVDVFRSIMLGIPIWSSGYHTLIRPLAPWSHDGKFLKLKAMSSILSLLNTDVMAVLQSTAASLTQNLNPLSLALPWNFLGTYRSREPNVIRKKELDPFMADNSTERQEQNLSQSA